MAGVDLAGLDLAGIARMLLVFWHLIGLGLAAVSVAFGDYAIFSGKRIDKALLRRSAGGATLALLLLWATGLGLVGLDTGFDLGAIVRNPKLLAKLSVVIALTLNGLGLHWYAFPRLLRRHEDNRWVALLATMLGVLSAVTWLYAGFLGVVKPAVLPLQYSGFMALYALAVGVAWLIALVSVWRKLQRRIDLNRLPLNP